MTKKKMTAKYDNSVCRGCGERIAKGSQFVWDDKERQAYCLKCSDYEVDATVSRSGNGNGANGEAKERPRMVTCDLCLRQVPIVEVAKYRVESGDFVAVCDFCQRTLACQERAKLEGLWVVRKGLVSASSVAQAAREAQQ